MLKNIFTKNILTKQIFDQKALDKTKYSDTVSKRTDGFNHCNKQHIFETFIVSFVEYKISIYDAYIQNMPV